MTEGSSAAESDALRQAYVALMDDMVQARSRIHALGAQLFRTRVAMSLLDRTYDHQSMTRLVIRLDGTPVFRSDGPVEGARDGRSVFAGPLAPGPHTIGIAVAQRGREDENYRYESESRFRFRALRGQVAEIEIKLEDDSNMDRDFESGKRGHYDVRTRVQMALTPFGEQ